MKITLKCSIIIFTVLIILLSPMVCFAEVKEIVSEGTYNMGDGETPNIAESKALLQAKRSALEQAGTYLESYSKVNNFQLAEDEIRVLASGIMMVNVLEKKRTIVGDGLHFWAKIKARVSTDDMEEMAKRIKEKSVLEDYKKIQEAYDTSQKEILALRKQLAATKTAQGKEKIKTTIAAKEKIFQANDLLDKKFNLGLRKTAVNDFAGVIPFDTANKISSFSQEVLIKTGAAIVVATVRDLGDKESGMFATELFNIWGIGKKGENNGVLIFLSMKPGSIIIRTGYGVERILTDKLCGQILDQRVIPYFAKGDYGTGLENAVVAVAQIIAKDAGVTLTGP